MRGSQLRLAPSLKVSACTGFHTCLIPLPNGPSFRTDLVYKSCPGVEDQLAPQRDEPGSMGVWVAFQRAKAARSRWVYLVSASAKDLMTKNTGLNFASPHSLNKAALTAISEAAR